MTDLTENKSTAAYQPDPYIRPGANLKVFVWLILLGLPALLLFLIYFKTAEKNELPIKPPTAVEAEPGNTHP